MLKDQNHDARAFVDYIAYCTQRALYDIIREVVQDLTWEEFVQIAAAYPAIWHAASDAALYALSTFDAAQFEFAALPPPVPGNGEDLPIVTLFDDQVGVELARIFLLKAVREHYERRSKACACTKEQYVAELYGAPDLARELTFSCGAAIQKVDFRGAWLRDGNQMIMIMLDQCR